MEAEVGNSNTNSIFTRFSARLVKYVLASSLVFCLNFRLPVIYFIR